MVAAKLPFATGIKYHIGSLHQGCVLTMPLKHSLSLEEFWALSFVVNKAYAIPYSPASRDLQSKTRLGESPSDTWHNMPTHSPHLHNTFKELIERPLLPSQNYSFQSGLTGSLFSLENSENYSSVREMGASSRANSQHPKQTVGSLREAMIGPQSSLLQAKGV